jgi:hypothetical protein
VIDVYAQPTREKIKFYRTASKSDRLLARLCAAPSTRRPSVAGLGVGGHEGRMTPPHPFTAFHPDEIQEKVTRWNNKGCGLDPALGEWRAVESPEGMVDGAFQQVRQT